MKRPGHTGPMASPSNRAGGELAVEDEILAERAAALARIAGTLERLIARLHGLRARLRSVDRGDRARLLERYETLRRRARRYRWYLSVQREVNGFIDGGQLERSYPIPGPESIPEACPGGSGSEGGSASDRV